MDPNTDPLAGLANMAHFLEHKEKIKDRLAAMNSIKITSLETVSEGKWLRFMNTHVAVPSQADKGERKFAWESVERTTRPESGVDGVELLVCTDNEFGNEGPGYVDTHNDPGVVLVFQYRPGARSICIEFPAGLVDANETTKDAALRELKEEVGFQGLLSVAEETPVFFLDPPLCNENGTLVHCQVDATDPKNHPNNLKQNLDEDECIVAFEVRMSTLYETLVALRSRGYGVDGRLMMFAYGVKMGMTLPKHK